MSTKKSKKSDEDLTKESDQEYFAEENNNKNDDKISFCEGSLLTARSRSARSAFHHSAFMVNCLTISHMRLLCLPGE